MYTSDKSRVGRREERRVYEYSSDRATQPTIDFAEVYKVLNWFQIYLPIAEVNINVLILVVLGISIGMLAGIFGLGGGVFIVPILIAIGIPSEVAVAISTNQMTASSFSGYLAYSRRGRVDYKLGSLMLVGGVFGTILGVKIFDYLRIIGYIDIFISIGFFILLATIGATTAKDALTLIYYRYYKKMEPPKEHHSIWLKKIVLPMQMEFISARRKISAFSPVIVGFVGGALVAMIGIGGSLVMLPAMLYILRISEAFTAGTSHFQITFTTILATILHSVASHNLDIVVSTILIIGAAFGVQIGARIGSKFHPENYRIFLALMLFMLCLRVGYGLFSTPDSIYIVERVPA